MNFKCLAANSQGGAALDFSLPKTILSMRARIYKALTINFILFSYSNPANDHHVIRQGQKTAISLLTLD